MKCPHCNKDMKLIAPADMNAEIYGGYPKSVTECCGNIVQFNRIITIQASIPYNHDKLTVDDWGNFKFTIKNK